MEDDVVVFSTMQKQHEWNARHIRNKKRVSQTARRGRLNFTRGREGLSERPKQPLNHKPLAACLPTIRRLLRDRAIVASASWLTRRFIRRWSSMAAEAWHRRTGLDSPCTDCCSPADSVLMAVLLPAFHSSSVTADGMALPVLGCLLAFRAWSCATPPPPFQMP